ncbi:MAG TPA: LPS assembly protein LptD, partial [Vicinamibacteria bacterium]|nr:LPS assembly protein LptD [Vicinamibacteria bacterium]
GYGFGHEFRYALSPQSRGTFRTYLFWPKEGDRDYDIDWNAAQTLPGGVRASVLARKYSSLSFNQRFNDSFNSASSRSTRGSLNLQKTFHSTTVQLLADSFDTYFGEDSFRVNRRLPSLQIRQSPKKIAKTGLVLDYEARGERLTLGDQDLVQEYSRLDFNPELSRPLQLTFLQLNPKVAYRYSHWSDTDAGDGTFTGPALDRQLFEGSVEMRGPSFSRVFDTSLGGYTNRIKHVIGPEVNFLYRTRVDDFLAIPKFDGDDYLVGTNQVTYSLVQRLLAKRPSPSGKLVPYEFFNWRVYQTYYVKIANNQNSFDPNYSSSAFGPSGVPDHNSPIASRIRLRPTPALSLDINHEYDVNYKQLRTQTYSLRVGQDRFGLQGTWSRSNRLSEDVALRVPVRDTVRGAARFVVLRDRLILETSTDYDFVRKQLLQAHAKAEWNVQCCGFGVEYIQYNFNSREERQWRFSVHLANIGDTANFLGSDDRAGRPAGVSSFR